MFNFRIADKIYPRLTLLLSTLTMLLSALAILLSASCSGGKAESEESDTGSDTSRAMYINGKDTPFHADNDIAMVIRSLIDAMSVNEKFTKEAYDFKAVLTDGAGAPLYIDSVGNPGMWEVSVKDPSTATVRNLHNGDLVASELADYVSSCLSLTDADICDADKSDESERKVYQLDSGHLVFESPGKDGLQGCIITVTVSKQI